MNVDLSIDTDEMNVACRNLKTEIDKIQDIQKRLNDVKESINNNWQDGDGSKIFMDKLETYIKELSYLYEKLLVEHTCMSKFPKVFETIDGIYFNNFTNR